ncbi:MAG TPA: hypothetical protein VE978_05345 [Chitinophagales bacterium]|nr:hypothetical protein [Chitinophagales bacterium]
MESQQKSHGATMQPRMRELHSKLTKLGTQNELLLILEKKGLTTPVQWYFIKQDIEALHQLTDLVQFKVESLLEGCNMIINENR